MHKKLNSFDYGNILLQPRGQSRVLTLKTARHYSCLSSYLDCNQEIGSIDPWTGSVRHMRRVAGIFSARSPFCLAKTAKMGSGAEIGRGYLHDGEISFGLLNDRQKP